MFNKKQREPERIPPILELIKLIWEEKPDLRLGQLILNLENDRSRLYNMEDDELLARMLELYLGLCGCGYASECVMHCNHSLGLCPGNAYRGTMNA